MLQEVQYKKNNVFITFFSAKCVDPTSLADV